MPLLLAFGLGPRDLRPFRSIAAAAPAFTPAEMPKTIPLKSHGLEARRLP